MKYITDMNTHENNLLPQTLKSRLLITDCDSNDNSDKDVVNKKYVDSTTSTLDVSKGLDMKGNKVINVADPTSAIDKNNESYTDTKTSNYLKTGGTRVVTGNLNMNSRSIINVKQVQAHESTHAANVSFVKTTISNSNAIITTNYQKYVNDRLNLSVGSTDLKNTFTYITNKIGLFSDVDDITGVKFINQDFHHFNKKFYELKLHLDSSEGYYSSHVGLNMNELKTGEYTAVFEL